MVEGWRRQRTASKIARYLIRRLWLTILLISLVTSMLFKTTAFTWTAAPRRTPRIRQITNLHPERSSASWSSRRTIGRILIGMISADDGDDTFSTLTPRGYPFRTRKHLLTSYNQKRGWISHSAALRSPTRRTASCCWALSPAIASLLAGSIGGAIGVGVAHPFDTLKTKAQVLAAASQQQLRRQQMQLHAALETNQTAILTADTDTLLSSTHVLQVQLIEAIVSESSAPHGWPSERSLSIADSTTEDTISEAEGLKRVSCMDLVGQTDVEPEADLPTRPRSILEQANGSVDSETEPSPLIDHNMGLSEGLVRANPLLHSHQEGWSSSSGYSASFSTVSPPFMGSLFVNDGVEMSTMAAAEAILQTPTPGVAFAQMGMVQMAMLIWQTEGFGGFMGGVRIMMIGQGLVKAVSFTTNAVTLTFLERQQELAGAASAGPPSALTLLIAATTAGFVSSFVVNPVERIKLMMQANGSITDSKSGEQKRYANEWSCLRAVLRAEGWTGFMGRGLVATMAREVPSDAIYFALYALLMQTSAADWFGPTAPLVFGAVAGCVSWLPVYPVDVVKTLVQNTEGGSDEDSGDSAPDTWQVIGDLYQTGGIGAFYDGITPKLIRAAIFHSVTFYLYELIYAALTTPF